MPTLKSRRSGLDLRNVVGPLNTHDDEREATTLYTDILPYNSAQPGVRWSDLETAVQVWTWMQYSEGGSVPPSVAETAKSFNTTIEIIRKCVRDSSWMLLVGPDDEPTKQRIEHDGE